MHVELLVEEPSAEAALDILVPRIMGPAASFAIRPHQDKMDLLRSLPGRMRGYTEWVETVGARVAVLVDEDREDCRQLKATLEGAAAAAGLLTRSAAGPSQPYVVVNRIAVEELEAWFFGDVPALCAAYPGVPASLAGQAPYRDPDAIRGGTWEALHRILRNAGYYPGALNKIETARRVAVQMDPTRNRSRSFARFRDALVEISTQSKRR